MLFRSAKLGEYINEEYPFYSEADIVVETRNERVENTVRHVISAINRFYDSEYKRKD